MNNNILLVYSIIAGVFILFDIVTAWLAFHKNSTHGYTLCHVLIFAAAVNTFYLCSVLTGTLFPRSEGLYAVFSGISFAAIDLMLVSLLMYVDSIVKLSEKKHARHMLRFLQALAGIDVLLQLINVISPSRFMIGYTEVAERSFAVWQYEMKLPYYLHLLFTYLLVIISTGLILHHALHVPAEYRTPYLMMIGGIVFVVIVNAIFLFIPSMVVDYSIFGYSIAAFIFYWSYFNYASHGMMNKMKTYIFDNISQGLMLFSHEDQLLLSNGRMQTMFPQADHSENATLPSFLSGAGITLPKTWKDSCSVQCSSEHYNSGTPLRLDVRKLTNKSGRLLGTLLAVTDPTSVTDLLTTFITWDNFLTTVKPDQYGHCAVAVFDINGLMTVNLEHGRKEGDRQITQLADTIRRIFPIHSIFIRGREALLMTVCPGMDNKSIIACSESVKNEYPGNIQYAVAMTTGNTPHVFNALATATNAMKNKKLLDDHSNHSGVISSMINTLQECDPDTLQHVERTRQLGRLLSKKIGLTEIQETQLMLLCLLHDIGKIGVPLDILNKPGKLTDEEWKIMKTHARKGYQITKGCSETAAIASTVLHHHERWDGKGYPDGLSKESIPLLSRVIAVVDAYDAMTNDRAYRKAISMEAAIQELKRNAGSQFDPTVVNEFVNVLKEQYGYRDPRSENAPPQQEQLIRPLSTEQIDPVLPEQIHMITFSRYILLPNLEKGLTVLHADAGFEKMTGYSAEDVKCGLVSQQKLICPEEWDDYIANITRRMQHTECDVLEHRLVKKDGTTLWVTCTGKRFYDSAARDTRLEIVITDSRNTYAAMNVQQQIRHSLEENRARWEKMYRHDSLTGLLTREAFRNDVQEHLFRNIGRYLLVMIDLDYFKEYNDTHGHPEGDEALVRFGLALKNALRANDPAGRMGGDEFAAMLCFPPDTTDEVIINRAQSLYKTMSHVLHDDGNLPLFSEGAYIARPGDDFSTAYMRADQALYRAKRAGREKLVFYQES